MEYVLLVAVCLWLLAIAWPALWVKYTAWVYRNFVNKEKE